MNHVFISYSTKNSEYALFLAEVLREQGFDVWIDNARLRSSDNWWEKIVKALRTCSAFIVIMTPESRASRWVQREVTLADQWRKPIFPVLLAGSIDDWEMLVLMQYEDVRPTKNDPQGTRRMPSYPFFLSLRERASTGDTSGAVITETLRVDESLDSDPEVQKEISNAPTTVYCSRRVWVLPGIVALVAILIGGAVVTLNAMVTEPESRILIQEMIGDIFDGFEPGEIKRSTIWLRVTGNRTYYSWTKQLDITQNRW